MKVIISSYLIFLSFYIIESARLSSKISQNITTTPTTIPTGSTVPILSTTKILINDSSSNKSLIKTRGTVIPVNIKTSQHNLKKQEQPQEYFTTQQSVIFNTDTLKYYNPVTITKSSDNKIKTTTSQYQQQHVQLPTYRIKQPVQYNYDTNTMKITNHKKSNRISVRNENEIDDNNQKQYVIDNDNDVADGDGGNENLKYGMKTITITTATSSKTSTKQMKNMEKKSALLSEKLKKQQQISKSKRFKQEISTKSSFSSSTDKQINTPKKYHPNTTSKTITTINTLERPMINNGPTKIQLNQKSTISSSSDTLVCPRESEAHFNLFAVNCKTDNDCTNWNTEFRCCLLFGSRNCHKGVAKPLKEPEHSPILGIIPRKCPQRPLAELFWNLKTCETDDDCWPRVCCPDGRNRYCRTSTPEYESVPFQIGRPLAYVSEYLECTAPPPPIFDLHPKSCNSTLDCFPNVCCQEAGKKNCRPPKKSVLSFMANFFNTGLLRRLTNNFVIKK